jgi:zinc transport system substrate-binding protein
VKKLISVLAAATLLVSSLCGCSAAVQADNKEDKIQIVTTIFPEYDWVMNVLGDNPANAESRCLWITAPTFTATSRLLQTF